MEIYRLYVTQRYATASLQLRQQLADDLHISVTHLSVYDRYDVTGVSKEEFLQATTTIFSEPPMETVTFSLPLEDTDTVIAVESKPGQYNARNEAAEQCLSLLTSHMNSTVRTARVYVFSDALSTDQINRIRAYLTRSIDDCESSLHMPTTLTQEVPTPAPICEIDHFLSMDHEALQTLHQSLQLAMTIDDLTMVQAYFQQERRNPTITEIRVLDTYWSDHCRHTTFHTALTSITFDDSPFTAPVKTTYERYLCSRKLRGKDRSSVPTLMDMATLSMKELQQQGRLPNLDVSDEVNACTIRVPVTVDSSEEEWLLFFKNETHNHPTEIEPFGGAATCLGGAIRDPLSGRAYVYQGMRITGCANPLQPFKSTLAGKLPQRYITTTAAKGFSSYGNQIGVPTGEVREYYHPSYIAKRLEVGAVIGAAPRSSVHRESPTTGDLIVLLGGKTGRDGCGGATGSSKTHTMESIQQCGAEVQKGNPLTERKLQRLFHSPEVTTCIKRCNDFGAGGVAVAIGELADSLHINLNTIPTKYAGLDGTELAISESQERMACVIAPNHWDIFQSYCESENIDATIVGHVTQTERLVMEWNGDIIVDLDRHFLNSNGATQEATAHVVAPETTAHVVAPDPVDLISTQTRHKASPSMPISLATSQKDRSSSLNTITSHEATTTACVGDPLTQRLTHALAQLNTTSQQGLGELFDSTVGGNTVLLPFSGQHQKTPVQGMVAKLPVLHGNTTTASIMTHGFDPYLSEWSPYHGAQYAVLLSVAKIAALGGDTTKVYLSLQEYFEKLQSPTAWGKVVSALLGAYEAQRQLGIAAIGGKDSMSGTFLDMTVPPTVISFAVTTESVDHIISPHVKGPNHYILCLHVPELADGTPDWQTFRNHAHTVHTYNQSGHIYSAYVVEQGGIGPALVKMCLGNNIGLDFDLHGIHGIHRLHELYGLHDVSKAYRPTEFSTFSQDNPFCRDVPPPNRPMYSLSEIDMLFHPLRGSILIEVDSSTSDILQTLPHVYSIGVTHDEPTFTFGTTRMSLDTLCTAYESGLSSVFPIRNQELFASYSLEDLRKSPISCTENLHRLITDSTDDASMHDTYTAKTLEQSFIAAKEQILCSKTSSKGVAKKSNLSTTRPIVSPTPRALIPIFPGTNCEYETERAFTIAGATVETLVLRNRTNHELQESILALTRALNRSQILCLAGGFSCGDEPAGSGKYIATLFRNPYLQESLSALLYERKGLVLGICNGFQALLKLGLLPSGQIQPLTEESPTLTYNTMGRHISCMVRTKVISTSSPWLSQCRIGDTYTVPISHGEGRFVATHDQLQELLQNQQIGTHYVDPQGHPSYDLRWNPNQSMGYVESILSPDGHVLGKMAHVERIGYGVHKNIDGHLVMPIFESGVQYFK